MKRIVAAVAAILLLAGRGQANLINDGDMEGAGSGAWITNSHANMQLNLDYAGDVYEGDEAARVSWSSTVPGWNAGVIEQYTTVSAGDQWYSEAMAKVVTTINNGEAYLETIFRDSGNNEVGKLQSEKLTTAGDWVKLYTTTEAAPAGTVSAQTRLVTLPISDSSGGEVLWDNVFASIPEPSTMLLFAGAAGGLILARRRSRRV